MTNIFFKYDDVGMGGIMSLPMIILAALAQGTKGLSRYLEQPKRIVQMNHHCLSTIKFVSPRDQL